MYGKLDSTSKHSVFEPLWKKNFGGMTWSKLWGDGTKLLGGGDISPHPPGICATDHNFTALNLPESFLLDPLRLLAIP